MVLGKLFNRGDARLRKIEKNEKKVTNLYIKPPDRQYYMDQLRQEGSTEAATALMQRFAVSIENTTVDRDEKEMAAHFLVSMGRPAIIAIKKYLKTFDNGVNWPFRALKDLVTEEELIAFLIEILDEIGPDYVRNPERKEQILTARDYPSPEMLRVVLPYIDDDNEPIRYIAVETVLLFDSAETAPALEERIREDESGRITRRIIEAFVEKEWKLSDVEATEPLLPKGYKVIRNRTIEKRGG